MDKVAVILVAVFAALTQAEDTAAKLTIESTKTYVNIGEEVNITCTVTGEVFPSGVFLEKIGDTGSVEILRNNLKTSRFAKYDRYTTTYAQLETGGYIFTLHIKVTELVDAGEYMCSVKPTKNDLSHSRRITINILKPADTMVLKLNDQEMNGDQIEFEEEETRNIRCEVTGSSPAATLHLFRGDHDLTHAFQIETTPQAETVDGERGLISTTYTTVAQADTKVTFGFSKGFRCSAMITNLPDQSRTFVAKFKGFPPSFQNCSESFASFVGDREVVFECFILSSPPASNIYISYPEDTNSENETHHKLFPGDTHVHYKMEVYEEGEHTKVTLHMERMFPQMFRQYQLHASNDRGHVQHELNIQRDPSRENASGAVYHPVSVLLLLVALVYSRC